MNKKNHVHSTKLSGMINLSLVHQIFAVLRIIYCNFNIIMDFDWVMQGNIQISLSLCHTKKLVMSRPLFGGF